MDPLSLYLVRHAKAESRSSWAHDDLLRPLAPKGMRQADELADRFGSIALNRLLSSPAVRCRQTLAPLSRHSGLPIEDAAELTEGAPLAGALELVGSLTAPTALSAHGDLIPEMIEALAAEGMDIDHPPRCQKAAVWTLHVRDGRFVAAGYTPPPG